MLIAKKNKSKLFRALSIWKDILSTNEADIRLYDAYLQFLRIVFVHVEDCKGALQFAFDAIRGWGREKGSRQTEYFHMDKYFKVFILNMQSYLRLLELRDINRK